MRKTLQDSVSGLESSPGRSFRRRETQRRDIGARACVFARLYESMPWGICFRVQRQLESSRAYSAMRTSGNAAHEHISCRMVAVRTHLRYRDCGMLGGAGLGQGAPVHSAASGPAHRFRLCFVVPARGTQ